jgi:hypothetical protein
MSTWVAHKSWQGEKWKLTDDDRECNRDMKNPMWVVSANNGNPSGIFCLPKSEYVEVPAPDAWIDVTSECEVKVDMLNRQQIWHKSTCIDGALGYRFTRKNIAPATYAFIVEQKQE